MQLIFNKRIRGIMLETIKVFIGTVLGIIIGSYITVNIMERKVKKYIPENVKKRITETLNNLDKIIEKAEKYL